jgi:hypothetical protein
MIRTALDAWPARRRLTALALFPVVATWLVVVGRGSTTVSPGAVWYPVVLVAGLLGAAVLASYLPVAGRGLDLGCTPCATLAALTLVGASTAMYRYGADIAGPLVASAVLLFGLTQRVSQPATCAAAPVRDGR